MPRLSPFLIDCLHTDAACPTRVNSSSVKVHSLLPPLIYPRLFPFIHHTMLRLKARLSTLVNPLVGEFANTVSGPLSPRNPSTSSTPLPPANKPTATSAQASTPQMTMQSSVDECQQVEPLHPSPNATCLAAPSSTLITRDSSSRSLIRPAASGSEVTASHNPQDRLPFSHSALVPSLADPPPITLLEGAHNFQMGDLNVSVFGAETQQNALEIQRGRLAALPKHPDMSGTRFEYIPDSRKPDVDKLCDLESNSTILVLCIHGPAGIGKSTLAGHLSDKFRSAGRLAATVFMSAIGAEASGPVTIVKMIAHEIGWIHPRAIPKIMEAMDQCHGTSLENHLEKYIQVSRRFWR
ncbi:hypothetical protein H1R20_g15459, partial [Candolleomyces eurysporus]